MRTEKRLPVDNAPSEEFCPECGQPWIWDAEAPADEEKRRGVLISPWILLALGLYVVVSLVPAVGVHYQFLIDEATAARVPTSTPDELAARDAQRITRVYLFYDLQELALAALIGGLGLNVITRRKLEAMVNYPGSREVSKFPGPESGNRWRTVLKAWALGETFGMSFVHVLLVTYVLVIVGLLRHGVLPSVMLLDQAWRSTFSIVIHAFDALFLGLP